MQYVENSDAFADSPEALKQSVNNFCIAYFQFDLTVNKGKIKITVQSPPACNPLVEPPLNVLNISLVLFVQHTP